jgi:MoaA/NifB/PqqE/SkfB family radical SAM enzyme
MKRIGWLLAHGVRTIHFCGGEPTIHPAIGKLVARVHIQGAKTKLTTNGIVVSNELISVLRNRRTEVKVSLHGDKEHHDRIVGRKAFDQTTENLGRLVAARVPISVQTTVVSGGTWVVDWVADYCQEAGVRRLGILPFIPRGSGFRRREEYELTTTERASLRDHVRRTRKALSGRVDVGWLDFASTPVPVVEADGSVVLEGETESFDHVVYRLP